MGDNKFYKWLLQGGEMPNILSDLPDVEPPISTFSLFMSPEPLEAPLEPSEHDIQLETAKEYETRRDVEIERIMFDD